MENIWKFEIFCQALPESINIIYQQAVGFINPAPIQPSKMKGSVGPCGTLYALVLSSLMKSWISPCTLAKITGQALCQPNQIKVANQKV